MNNEYVRLHKRTNKFFRKFIQLELKRRRFTNKKPIGLEKVYKEQKCVIERKSQHSKSRNNKKAKNIFKKDLVL